MAKKLKPIPMPVEMVLHSRHMQCAPGPVHRAIITISCHYWASGAPLTGIEEETARAVARIPSGHWNAIRATVLAALGDILPELATTYAALHATREKFRAILKENGARGRAIAMARHRARKEEASGKTATAQRIPLKTPQIAGRYDNPRACMSAQELAALPTTEVREARFVDK